MFINEWCYLCTILHPVCVLLPRNLHQLKFLTLPIPEYATPHPGWSFTSPPNVSTANPASDTPGWGWFLCLVLFFSRQIWICCLELIITVLLGLWRHCKFNPTPLLLITYHPLPLYSAALVLSFSLILTTSHLSVLHPLPYSLKQFLDLTPSLGIAVPPGIVLMRYQCWGDHIPHSIGHRFHYTGNVDYEVVLLIYIEVIAEDPKVPEAEPPPTPLVYNGSTHKGTQDHNISNQILQDYKWVFYARYATSNIIFIDPPPPNPPHPIKFLLSNMNDSLQLVAVQGKPEVRQTCTRPSPPLPTYILRTPSPSNETTTLWMWSLLP